MKYKPFFVTNLKREEMKMPEEIKDLTPSSFTALVVARVKEAWDQFGRCTFYDKGAQEVMEISDFADPLMEMTPNEAAVLLSEIYKTDGSKYHPQGLVMWFEALDNRLSEEAGNVWYDALFHESDRILAEGS